MAKTKNIRFKELLEQRRKLSKENLHQVKRINIKDFQLQDTVKNFKE